MERERELVVEYGHYRRERRRWLGDLRQIVVSLLHRSVPQTAVQEVFLGRGGWGQITFEFEGRDYLVSFTNPSHELTDWEAYFRNIRESLDDNLRGRRWVHVHWRTEPSKVDEQMVAAVSESGVLVDTTYLEAAVAGLFPLAELIRDVFRRQRAYVPLADMLAHAEPAVGAWAMTPTSRLSSPVRVEAQTWGAAAAEVLLVGQAQDARPSGLAWLRGDTVLITCPDGLLEVDAVRGHTRWLLALPGCHGAPLVRSNGEVLVMCGSALVRWHKGQLSTVAGGFEDGSVLMSGPEREPWVLSGSGVTFGTGEGSLALTRAGERVGEQMRYPISFDAAVRSAVWLDRRRFFLAASGHSAVIDLARTTDAGQREEWIPTPVHFPAHVLRASADSVLSGSPDGTGSRVALHRTDVTSRLSEPVAEARLGEVFGLDQDPDGGAAYLLGSLPDNDPTRARPALMRFTGLRTRVASRAAVPTLAAPAVDYDMVRQAAQGERRDYRLDRLPLNNDGGQAQVFRAEHKSSGTVVALKRRRGQGERDARRMRREVEIAQRLGANPNVMPVLDFSPAYDWFVMPLAEATVEDKRSELQNAQRLRALVDAVSSGLAEAHQHGWIHRDIKPSNILLLDLRWVVADWGIVRRPRGQTSAAGLLTRSAIGTEGFAAPELSVDGHDVMPATDIYSLGQLIGWIFTGTWPQANVPLLPPPGPWYGVVRQATQLDPARRPQDMAAFLDLVERETGAGSELPIARAQRLLEAAEKNDTGAAAQLLALAADQPGSYELYLDVISRMKVTTARKALLDNPAQAAAVVQALTRHAAADDWPTWEEADRAVWWLLDVARLAARENRWALLDTAVQGMCDWDGRFDRWKPQNDIKDWMRELTGQAASIVASALRAQPDGASHLHELADDRRVDQAIRSAVYRP